MFDIAPSELMLVGTVALIVIGPKDLPKAMRFVGQWVGKARGMARHFRSGLDEMVRQAEMEEMEKKWADENARIMAEHPPAPPEEADDALMASAVLPAPASETEIEPGPEPEPEREPVASQPEPIVGRDAPELPLAPPTGKPA